MIAASSGGKWLKGLHGDTPCVVAAQRVFKRRLSPLPELVRLAAEQAEKDVEHVHQLRVQTRRAGAALRLFHRSGDGRSARKLAALLRKVRRAAGRARIDDVHARIFADDAARLSPALKPAFEYLIKSTLDSRARVQRRIVALAASDPFSCYEQLCRRLQRSVRAAARRGLPGDLRGDSGPAPYTLSELAACELPALLDEVTSACGGDLNDLADVHRLRIAGKRLRYVMELLAGCFPPEFRERHYARIEEMQTRLGEINDLVEIVARIERLVAPPALLRRNGNGRHTADAPLTGRRRPPAGLADVLAYYREQRDARHRNLLEWWGSPDQRETLDLLHGLVREHCLLRRGAASPLRGAPDRAVGVETGAAPPPPVDLAARTTRVAAIDVGTNSIRLVIAELDPHTRYRVIDDLKESTRLGSGLYTTGRLQDGPIEKSLRALQRMKLAAERQNVTRLRAVGTSALREAENAGDFLDLVRREAGIHIDVIDAEHEARLALSSVSNAFDLGERRAAVVDIGGGSTEMVLTSGGVIDAIHKLPLGGVRLTELYADPQQRGGYRFGEMRRAVARVIQDLVGEPVYRPEFIIGAGGTFTNLARISIRRGAAGDGRFPFAVRGYELTRDEVAFLLDWLRRLSPEERRRVPGVSGQRSEVLVAGVCIVDQLMEHLGVGRLRTHDGGIRDGLLAEMIDELGLRAQLPRGCATEAIDAVRRFAERVSYERPHSEHVARLALRIFDQLVEQAPAAAGAWATDDCREYLHAAAVLHDVGMLISWRRHHKHSYDMIVHADLPCFARREIEIIANVARYHRKRGPLPRHRNFRKLADDDRRVVSHLAGILRIADGLDRLHTQNVRDVVVRADGRFVRFDVIAADDAAVNIKFARRKSDVFAASFHTAVHFLWTPAARQAKAPTP